jgi:hypothetical protein
MGLFQASLDSSGVTLRHHRQYHHHHRQQLPQLQQQQQLQPQHAPTCRHRLRSPSAGADPKESPANHFLSVDHDDVANDDTDSSSNSNLCPNAGRIVVAAVGPEGFQVTILIIAVFAETFAVK